MSGARLPPGPLLIGDYEDGTPYFYTHEGSLVTIGPPGSGKTQCHVLPNLVTWTGPSLVIDVTGVLWEQTSRQRNKFGPVYRVDLDHPDKSDHYNPLMTIRRDADVAWSDAQAFTDALYVKQGGEKNAFFDNQAIKALTACACYVAMYYPDHLRNIEAILDIVAQIQWDSFIKKSVEQTDIPALKRAATEMSKMNHRTLGDVLSTVNGALQAWQDNRLCNISRMSDWRPADLRKLNATVYICASPHMLRTNAGFVRLIVAQHVRALMERIDQATTPWTTFFLDELPQLGGMDIIRELLDVGRNSNVRLWMFMQYVSQLEEAYGQNIANGMIGACGLRAYLNPSLADGTAERVSKELGDAYAVIDRSQRRVAEPQVLAGDQFKDYVIALVPGEQPRKLAKHSFHGDRRLNSMMGEAD